MLSFVHLSSSCWPAEGQVREEEEEEEEGFQRGKPAADTERVPNMRYSGRKESGLPGLR